MVERMLTAQDGWGETIDGEKDGGKGGPFQKADREDKNSEG